MSPKDSQSLDHQREIFTAALSVPENGRAAFLDEACRGDLTTRAAVEDLLAYHLDDDFLVEPAVDRPQERGTESTGGQIGPYHLKEEVGRGGMGVVFRAEQVVPLQRQVAVKIIRAGMDSEEVIKRFALERQALAVMDHPHIAKILDAGTTPSFRPYFVMEFVEGVKVTEYCQRHHLTIGQRLSLFADVCAAVQHAHQKGIIHRDLKPGNVLVTLRDGTPIPKVIDFGIAKAVEATSTEQATLTRFGTFMGTLAYMSPEQAGAIPAGVDTRADIYALGVLLYEMLTGVTPFEPSSTSGPEAFLRMIREEDPPKPSTRLTQSRKLSAKQARRSERQIPRDLDWIILKALEKDPQRRYATVNAMVLDVKRFLQDEPVSAAAPQIGYRLRKFIRRHRAATLGAAAVLVSLVGGFGFAVWSSVQERRAREFAEDQRYASDMKLALMTALSHDQKEVQSLLEKHIPPPRAKDRRGWLWHYLQDQCHQELRGTVAGGPSLALATSPNGRWIAHARVQGTNGLVEILDSATLSVSNAFEFKKGFVSGMRFSQDSSRLLMDPSTAAPALEFVLKSGQLTEVTPEEGWDRRLTPDGRHLILLQELEPRSEQKVLRCQAIPPVPPKSGFSAPFRLASVFNMESTMLVSPDSSKVAIACLHPETRAHEIRVFSIPDLNLTATLQVPAEVLATAWSPDSRFILSGYGYPFQVDLWRVEDSQHIRSLKGLKRSPSVQVAFSLEGDLMASTELSGLIQIWEIATGELRREFAGRPGLLAFCAGGRELVTAYGGEITVWDASPKPVTELRRLSLQEDLWNLQFTPDGSLLAASSTDGVLRVFDAETEALHSTLESAHRADKKPSVADPDVSLQFSADGRRVGMVTSARTASVFALDSSQELCSVRHPSRVQDISLSPDGRWLATAGDHANLIVWNTDTGEQANSFDAGGLWLTSVAFSPDPASGLLAFSHDRSKDNLILVRLNEDWKRMASLPGRIASLTFSPDARLLVCGMRRQARIYEVATLRLLDTIDGADGPVPEVSFSPDGSTLAIPCWGGFVQFWNRRIRAEVGRYRPSRHHGTWMISAQFSPDGSTLAMSTRDDGIHVLRMAKPSR